MTSRKTIKQAIKEKDYITYKKCLEEDKALIGDDFIIMETKNSGDKLLSSILVMMMNARDAAHTKPSSFVRERRQKFITKSDELSRDRIRDRKK